MSTTSTTEGRTIHWARLYDLGTALCGRRIRALHRAMIELAAIAPGQRILDVGCGPGRLTLAAAQAAGPTGTAVGIDPPPEKIALGERKEALEVQQAPSRALFLLRARKPVLAATEPKRPP